MDFDTLVSAACCVHNHFQTDASIISSHSNILAVTAPCFPPNTTAASQWFHIGIFMSNESFKQEQCSSPTTDSNVPNHNISYMFLLLWILLLLITITSNILVVLAVFKTRVLKSNVANLLIVSLAISDLMVGCFIIPFKIKTTLNDQKFTPTLKWCRFYIVADNSFFTVSIMNLLIISLDRYTALNFPYVYPNFATRRRMKIFILAVWMYGFMWGLLANLNWGDVTKPAIKIEQHICMVNDNKYYIISVFLFVFLAPVIAMGMIYAQILLIARKHALTIRKISSCSRSPSPVKALVSARHRLRIPQSPSPLLSLRNKHFDTVMKESKNTLRNSSVISSTDAAQSHHKNQIWQYRKMIFKASKTVAAVYGTFVIAWTPVCIISLLTVGCDECFQNNDSTWYYHVFVELLPILSSTLNPFIYGLMNKQYRKAFRTLLESYKILKVRRSLEKSSFLHVNGTMGSTSYIGTIGSNTASTIM